MAQAGSQPRPADAVPGNWVERWAPEFARPYLRLARADRPIGAWLLMWPCWWSVALAGLAAQTPYPDPWLLLLFFVGAFSMRAAGCAWNDIVDCDYDAQVARTRGRPIPSGQVTVRQAQIQMVALSLVGLLVLIQMNPFTIALGIASLAIVAVYPFMKRVTYWPQVVFAFAFSWGSLMGWAAVFGSLGWAPLLLYAGAVSWNVAYDTIYAHQDKEDDALVGLKSTALRFGESTKSWLVLFYGLALAGILAAGLTAGAGVVFLIVMGLAAAHLAWQVATLNIADSGNCLRRFRANRDLGLIVFLALAADAAVGALA